MTKHIKSHDNAHLRWNRNTNEKPFKCTFKGCDKSFTAKSSLQNHYRSHKPADSLACPFESCFEPFKDRESLDNHIKFRHGQSVSSLGLSVVGGKYPCSHPGCRCSFRTEADLKLHLTETNNKLLLDNNFLKSNLLNVLKVLDHLGTTEPHLISKVS